MIFHITTRSVWREALARGAYQAESLAVEGFIHGSSAEQILGVANAFYTGTPDLVLLWIDPERVIPPIRWEVAPGAGGEAGGVFPHIYGPLNLEAVIRVAEFVPDAEGVFRAIPQGE